MTWDDKRLRRKLARLQALSGQLPQMAARTQAEALGHAIIGAQASVYQTTPGAYQRTQDYLRGFHASSRTTRHTASVTVWNDVEYAPFIERGTDPSMGDAQLLAILQRRQAPDAPLTFGRSGQRFTLPGPAVLPAVFYAGARLKELFRQGVREASR